uniref:BPTI/Kunitz inhibitor domain-containing protein n=1 Tax=Parascaris equorum TaxID=6256 RepID=A0A914SHH4_PAREQ
LNIYEHLKHIYIYIFFSHLRVNHELANYRNRERVPLDSGLINPNTGVYVQCSPTDPSPCQAGFICVKSVLFNSHICCSNTAVDNKRSGSILEQGDETCLVSPSFAEFVCSQARDIGSVCTTSTPTITRYYFDATNGLCRSFEFTQCGGNENNFPTLQ